MSVKEIVIIVTICYVVWQLVTNRFDLLDSFVFLLPLKSLVFDFVLMVWGFYIPLVLLLCKLIFFQPNKIRISKSLLFFLTYVIISTLIISNFFIDVWSLNPVHHGYFRGKGRYISTLIKVIFFELSIAFLLYCFVNNLKKLEKLINTYLKSLTFLALTGILQFIIYLILGIDIFPIGVTDSGVVRTAPVMGVFQTLDATRASSIGGEPKGLSSTLAIGLVILLTFKNDFVLKYRTWLVPIFILALACTFSRSGYGLFMIYLFLSITFFFIKSPIKFKLTYFQLGLVFFFILTFIILGKPIYVFIENRFIENFDKIYAEDVDFYIQEFLYTNPNWLWFGSGSGNIHNLVDPLIPTNKLVKGLIFMSRYGYMRLLSENGIIGFLLFTILFLSVFINLLRINKRSSNQLATILFFLFLFFLARSNYAYSEFLFVMGLGLAYLKIYKRSKNLRIGTH